LGPRVKLQLHKIEEGLFRGNVVYHSHSNKSAADVRKQLDGLKNKRELKDKRKKIQEENVAKKKKVAEDKEGKWVKDDDSDDAEDGDKSKSNEKRVTKSDDFKKKSFSKSPSKSSDK
jgi:ribosome biogenesis protein SSF1/2